MCTHNEAFYHAFRFLIFATLLAYPLSLITRSIHRPYDPLIPEITTRWIDETKTYRLRDTRLQEYALFKTFDKEHFYSHLLPQDRITFRNHPERSVNSAELNNLIEEFVNELRVLKIKKTHHKHFVVLKQRDFNPITCSGIIILKFKRYPFVVKLFLETPQTFVDPFSKGFEPIVFFIMGGGANRYSSGLLRIKNLEIIRQRLKSDPYWSERIDTPRKWFWLSKNTRWFELKGKNIGAHEQQSCELPSIYGIIADEIDSGKVFTLFNKEQRDFALQLSRFLGISIDPHIDNFMYEELTGKIVLVDTEHFGTMVGLRKPFVFDSYFEWYLGLARKFTHDKFLRNKKVRRALQRETGIDRLHTY